MDEAPQLQPLSQSQREQLEEATALYEAHASEAAEILSRRGITRAEATEHRLGVVRDPLPGHERYRGFLAIPYLDRFDKPLTMRFRCLQEHDHRQFGHGKYMSISGDPARVYGIKSIHQADDEIHLTEGELDRVVLEKVGLKAAAIPGASGWSRHHRPMFAGFSRVWVWGDPDDAGAEFNRKVTSSLRQAKAVRLRTGDVTDTYRASGYRAEALLELVK